MSITSRSGAVACLGATGDLAHQMIFPVLHAMARRGPAEAARLTSDIGGWRIPPA